MRTMASTLRDHHPDAQLTLLVLDGDARSVGEVGRARLLGLEDVLGEQAGLIAAVNPPGALAFAVLPHLARKLLDAGARSVIYIGPGQRVLGPLEELEQLLADRALVLVARLEQNHPMSWRRLREKPNAASSAATCWACAPGRRPRRCSPHGRATSPTPGDGGNNAVRAWLERLPAFAEGVGVLRHPGYGLDPWTLAQRTVLGGGADGLQVDGTPARLIDFDELDPDDPPSLFAGEDRVRLSREAALAQLTARGRGPAAGGLCSRR